MGADTTIEWTDATWNPVRGCSRVSAGCTNCYAEGVAARFSGVHPKTGKPLAYHGLARRSGKGLPLWTGEVRMVPEHLADPLRWRHPRRIFVNSMSDLFHEKLTNEQIAAVFGVMAAAPHHTFQVLTKRARRMREWFEWAAEAGGLNRYIRGNWAALRDFYAAGSRFGEYRGKRYRTGDDAGAMVLNAAGCSAWPLPNVWLGVSCENQETADERIPQLLACPAAVRFISAEPLLGYLRLDLPLLVCGSCSSADVRRDRPEWLPWEDPLKVTWKPQALRGIDQRTLDWVIVGGESGRRARPFDLAWARLIVDQCRAAKVAVFVKQLGARPLWNPEGEDWWKGPHTNSDGSPRFSDCAGGDPAEWPSDLRVREFPGEARP